MICLNDTDLNHWLATHVMGWRESGGKWWLSEQDARLAYTLEDDGYHISYYDWNPCQLHDQAQIVLEKLGINCEVVCELLNAVGVNRIPSDPIRQSDVWRCLTATPRQKMEAVWRALQDG